MATFHSIQMNDPLEKGDDSPVHGSLFSSATVAQSHLQVRLGKEVNIFMYIQECLGLCS